MRFIFVLFFAIQSCYALNDIHEYHLDNGLSILVKEDHRAPVAVSMIWYNVGSADEQGGKTGLAHALEHIMFKGTPKFPKGIFSQTIARLGGQENAFTNSDYTAFFENIAANKLATCFELEADRMVNLLIDKTEFSKEIKVIQEERRMRTDDNPQALTFERFRATAHLTMPYQHPVIGWMTDLKQMTANELRAWYKQFYAPDNATLVVVGDVNPDNVFALAKQYFGPITKKAALTRVPQSEPQSLGMKKVLVQTHAKLPLIMLGYTTPGITTAKVPYEPYALELIAGILDAGESARFSKHLIRGTHVASSASAYYDLYTRYQTQFILFGIPSQEHTIKELRQQLLAEIKTLQTTQLSTEELERVKTQIIAQKTFEKDSLFGQAMALGLLKTIGLNQDTEARYVEKIKAITPDQIQQAAIRYFQPNTLTEAVLIPAHDAKENA